MGPCVFLRVQISGLATTSMRLEEVLRKGGREQEERSGGKVQGATGRYVSEDNHKLPLLCFCFVLKMLMSSPELRSLN